MINSVCKTYNVLCKQAKKNIKLIQIYKCQSGITNFCDGILNFEPGMMLGQNL